MSNYQRGFKTYPELRRWKQHVPYGAVPAAPSTIIQPPFDATHNVWSFDPDGVGAAQYVTGPTGTVTTPVKTQGTPSFYTFGATDRIDFGDALDTTWAGATPQFTLYIAAAPSSGDIAAAAAILLSKDNGSSARQWVYFLASGKPTFVIFSDALAAGTFANRPTSAAITAGRHVLAVTFDGTQALQSRVTHYVDGSAVSQASETGTGSGSVDTTATLRIGERADALAGVTVGSYAYAYSGVHSAGTVASITSWLQTAKGWV